MVLMHSDLDGQVIWPDAHSSMSKINQWNHTMEVIFRSTKNKKVFRWERLTYWKTDRATNGIFTVYNKKERKKEWKKEIKKERKNWEVILTKKKCIKPRNTIRKFIIQVKRAMHFAEAFVLLLVSELHRTSKWPYVLFIYFCFWYIPIEAYLLKQSSTYYSVCENCLKVGQFSVHFPTK